MLIFTTYSAEGIPFEKLWGLHQITELRCYYGKHKKKQVKPIQVRALIKNFGLYFGGI